MKPAIRRVFLWKKYERSFMKLPKAYATSVRKRAIDMTLSVNPLGCSPRVINALSSVQMTEVSSYPDADRFIGLLATTYGVAKENCILGNGSEMLIKLVSQAFLTPGDTVLVEAGSFFLFSKEPELCGATVRFFDAGSATKPRTRPAMLFMANPTTPGGIERSADQLNTVIDALNPRVVVIDEANAEFCDATMIDTLRARKNLIVLRTFSKVYGLAGLRIGAAFGTVGVIRRMKEFIQPFPVSAQALNAAQAALSDNAFITKTKRFIASERRKMTNALTRRGFRVSASVTNNLFVSRSDNAAIIRALESRGVSVIDGKFFPGNTMKGFRISLKDTRTNIEFLKRLDSALACVSKNNLLPSKEVV
jgi:histidinol-phosphate aminotransferase